MKKKKIIITVMEPIVENVSSKNVASKEISDEEAIERFGDFDNREDGK